jgi:integrase
VEWNLLEGPNPVMGVKMLKKPRRRLRFLETGEEDALLAVCVEPLKTIIRVSIYTGLRLHSEALTLRWDDIDLRRRTLAIQAAYSKNGKMRTVPLHSLVVAALDALARRGEYVFTKDNGMPYRSAVGLRRPAAGPGSAMM